MGAHFPLLLQPSCPPVEDPGIVNFLHLAAKLCSAPWVELVLQPVKSTSARTYRYGTPEGPGNTSDLEVGDEFIATIRVGCEAVPEQQSSDALSCFLKTLLDRESLRTQSSILGAALDANWSSVLLFDAAGNILYANTPADRLLSLQTEDKMQAETEGEPAQPLFTLLCSLADRVVSPTAATSSWQGTINTMSGQVLSGKVACLSDPESGPQAVLVLLQQERSEVEAGIDAFSALHHLSRREREVVQLLRDGLSTAAMAERLSISPHTVRDHLKNLYKKTETNSRSELLGLISRGSRTPVASSDG